MLTTNQILDLLGEKLGTDYRVSRTLGKEGSYISHIRARSGILTDHMGLKAAEILDFPEEFILLSLAAERAKESETMKRLAVLAAKYEPPKTYQTRKKPEKRPLANTG